MKENSSTFGIIVNVGNLSSTRTRLNVLGRDPEPIHLSALHEDRGDLQVLWDLFGQSVKDYSKEQVCLFSNCDFCPKNDSEPLHRVLTDSMGKTLLQIKQKTPDDHRISTRTDHSNVPLIRSVCDAQLVLAIQNTLSDEDVTLSMAEVNDAYLSILKRYRVDVNESENYRKYLKRLISERLPEVKFVTSLRRNEPDRLVLSTAVTMAMDYRSSMMNDDEIVGHLKNVANLLREEMLQQPQLVVYRQLQ
ncbi:hypothetical protein GWK47_038599 [Chionoecetes opilio]|uniref:Uncharacterized protein n=1 Tax=Chionoecetes opilio TaxID=41210 RepID=A0A8J5CY71_CHIOP|nr:hypothetical protein GWK47_038599 [Chionoecetes opilio]